MGEVFEGFGYENVEDNAEEANTQGQLNELEISELIIRSKSGFRSWACLPGQQI